MRGSFGHVRVKRHKTTAFVVVDIDGGATGGELRAKAAHAFGVRLDDIQLRHADADFTAIEDRLALRNQGVSVDGILCAVLKNGNGQWETPHIITPDER